jgi:hypothetical protein
MDIDDREAVLQAMFDAAAELGLECEVSALTMHEAFGEEWLEDLSEYADSELYIIDPDGNHVSIKLDWELGAWYLCSDDGQQQIGKQFLLDSPGLDQQIGALLAALFDS